MATYLIVDSGSTKTEWCFLKNGKKPVHFKTPGINPFLQSKEDISAMLDKKLKWDHDKYKVDKISYFGAGASSVQNKKVLSGILKNHFDTKDIEVQSDLLAAAKALCGENKGIVSILGTGSSSCYYNGKKIKDQLPSLGYIAGDEGSGNYMGKRILQYYTYGTFDGELKMAFEMRFGNDIKEIIRKLYHEPYPNRYLASFVPLLLENRGHYMIENIIEDCLNDFFHSNILKYRESWNLPLFFSGSVAYEFKDVIKNLCNQYELELGKVEKDPMKGLIKYYASI
jgi:N-acetylglucosamine kinase-like BadF-type ATPase